VEEELVAFVRMGVGFFKSILNKNFFCYKFLQQNHARGFNALPLFSC